MAQLSTTSCPDEALVLRYLGGLAREHATTIEQHVDRCRECREWIGMLARTSLGLPSASLAHVASPRPGEFLPAVRSSEDRRRRATRGAHAPMRRAVVRPRARHLPIEMRLMLA